MKARLAAVLVSIKLWTLKALSLLWQSGSVSSTDIAPADAEHVDVPLECIIETVADVSPENLEVVPRSTVSVKRRKVVRTPATPDTLWQFRAGLLDHLDEYFFCIRRMRKIDPHAYSLFSRIGFSIPADAFINPEWKYAEQTLKTSVKVANGGILLGGLEKQDHTVNPSFLYFQKIGTPSRVQRSTGDIYRMTVLYDDRIRRSSLVAGAVCHIAVDADGRPHLLRELVESTNTIHPGRKQRGAYRRATFTRRTRSWSYPSWVFEAAQDRPTPTGPTQWAEYLFTMCFLTALQTQRKIIVRVKHDGVTAAFGIEASRAKRFFIDRDGTEIAADGKRKRIFHSVIAHERIINAEKTVEVRQHYRGLRHFDWNSYRVAIVFPKNNDVMEFDSTAKYENDIKTEERKNYMKEAELGRTLDELLSA